MISREELCGLPVRSRGSGPAQAYAPFHLSGCGHEDCPRRLHLGSQYRMAATGDHGPSLLQTVNYDRKAGRLGLTPPALARRGTDSGASFLSVTVYSGPPLPNLQLKFPRIGAGSFFIICKSVRSTRPSRACLSRRSSLWTVRHCCHLQARLDCTGAWTCWAGSTYLVGSFPLKQLALTSRRLA